MDREDVEYVRTLFERFQEMYKKSDFFAVYSENVGKCFYKLKDDFNLNYTKTKKKENDKKDFGDEYGFGDGYCKTHDVERARGKDDKTVLLVFLFELINNAGVLLRNKNSSSQLPVELEYFDKKFIDSVDCECSENWNSLNFFISRHIFLRNTIKDSMQLSDAELGQKIRRAWFEKPKKYSNEFFKFFTDEERRRCKAIFDIYLKMNKNL